MILIYGIFNGSTCYYVGKTKWRGDFDTTIKWRKKGGWSFDTSGMEFRELELTKDVSMERKWISFYRESGHPLNNKYKGDGIDRKEYSKQWRLKNPDYNKEYYAEWYKKNYPKESNKKRLNRVKRKLKDIIDVNKLSVGGQLCSTCNKFSGLWNFTKDKKYKWGRKYECKSCASIRYQKWKDGK